MEYSISIDKIINLLAPLGLVADFSCPRASYYHDFSYLSYDSQDIRENTFFICKGVSFKEQYLKDAIKAGACAYISEKVYSKLGKEVPFVQVTDIRKAMSLVAAQFYGYAYRDFKLVGITGTKGKTTTSYFMKNILDSYWGNQTAILSTIAVYTGEEDHDAHLTTPESPHLQRYFAQTKAHGIPFLTMEVSSQAYLMDRVYGVEYDVGIFLNIGEDHIGPMEHRDFEDYLSCKLQLMRHSKVAVINREMEHFQRVLEVAKQNCQRVITVGKPDGTLSSDDWSVDQIEKLDEGFSFVVSSEGYEHSFCISMAGRFNVENALAALVAAKVLGVDDRSIEAGLQKSQVKGRMNLFEKDGITVLVDYAHNYLSFSKLYQSIKADYPGRRIVVLFGCPGGKAQLRRRDIGTLSGENADYIYLTAEDPQFEDVTAICEEIAEFIKPYKVPYEIIPDRTEAIETAIAHAQKGDIILLSAKGEEVYQKVRGEYVYFESDIAIAKRCLNLDANTRSIR